MAKAYVASPALDLITAASLSATNENAAYPATNLQDYDPANVFKATSTATTITVTHVSAARYAIAFINHNLAGATVTAGAVSVTIPARTADGQCVNAFGVLNLGTSTTTSIVITGASANVQIGRIVLVSALQDLNWVWGSDAVTLSSDWPIEEIVTFSRSSTIYDKGIRMRRASGRCTREADRTTWVALAQAAKGRNIPFLFIPDLDVNDCWYVRLTDSSLTNVKRYRNASDTSMELSEVSMGLPL